MSSETKSERESPHIGAAVTIQLGHGIGDISGDWIDAIWEAGDEDPAQGSHIVIECSAHGFKVSGTTYSAPEFGDDVGRFRSTDTMISSTADGFVYQYEGMERARRGGPKNHNGAGFYRFHRSGDLRTFTGAFAAWEEDRNRRVEGRQLTGSEALEIKERAGRESLFRKFLSKKKARAGAESVPPLDTLFPKRLLDVLTKNNLDREINELKAVWGRNPLCMAFLLRTLLEKALTKAFLKQGLRSRIEKAKGELVDLNKMIEIAMQERVSGVPILTPQTGKTAHSIRISW